ncbi:MAG TPA: hypothetical protein VMH20_05745 [Verrucomicrobiae bacterium]|nr:hypothetical protein [Verrucomicrobiae bacterium]
MSLLEPPPEKSHKPLVMAITIGGLVIALALVLYFTFRYYPEKKATAHFFDALVAGDTDRAYQLWKPGPSYRKDDFLADWGPAGYYGPVKSYEIMGAKEPNKSNAIAVDVAVSPFSPLPSSSDAVKSQKTKVVTIWVAPSDKSLTFPP